HGAEARYWREQEWNVLEQRYDLSDVYVCNIEVEVLAAADIPICCPRHNLYGYYVQEADVHNTADHRLSTVLRTKAMHYRLCYLPAAAYHCHFVRGMHRIFYFVAKDSVLLRQRSPELGEDIGPVEALRIKLSTPEVSPALPLVGRAYDAIQRFLHRPGTTYLRRYVTIHALV